MRGTRRFALCVTATATFVALLGFAGPAHAIYRAEPRPLAWNPDGAGACPSRRGMVATWSSWAGSSTAPAGSPPSTRPPAACCGCCTPATTCVRWRCRPTGPRCTPGQLHHGRGRRPPGRGGRQRRQPHPGLVVEGGRGRHGARPDRPRRRRLRLGEGHQRRRCPPAWHRRSGRHHRQARRGLRLLRRQRRARTGPDRQPTDPEWLLHPDQRDPAGEPGLDRPLLDYADRWSPAKLCSNCDQYWDVQTDGTNAYVATSGNAAGAFRLATGQPTWKTIRGTGDFQAAWVPGDGRVYYGGHFGEGVWSSGSAAEPGAGQAAGGGVHRDRPAGRRLVAEAHRGLPRDLGVHLDDQEPCGWVATSPASW